MDDLFNYLAFFGFAFFVVLGIVVALRILDMSKALQVHADGQRKLLETIHGELQTICQALERR